MMMIDPKMMMIDPKVMTIDPKMMLLKETNLKITGPTGYLGKIETIKQSSGNHLLPIKPICLMSELLL